MTLTRSAFCLVAALLGAARLDAQQSPAGGSIGPARPQTPSAPALAPLTLDEAITRGLANSLRLAELEARQDSVGAIADGRAAARRPIAAAYGGYTRTNHVEEFAITQPGQGRQVVYPDLPDNFRARLDLQWLFYTGGRLDALERAARAERQASGEELAAARSDLRLEITRAFWALVTAREAEQVLARALESTAAYVRTQRARLDQGLIPPNELLSAEALQSREQLVSIEAGNARGIAEADLRRLLGVDGAPAIEPAARLEPVVATIATVADVDQLIAAALAARPERRALSERVEAARARMEAARAGLRPQVGVNGGYEYASPNPRFFPRSDQWQDSWDVSVNASWTLWDGGRTQAERADAAALARVAEARLSDFDRQVTFEVRQRQLELGSSLAAIATATEGVRAAAEARRVIAERFTAGVVTNTEVLDAQTALLQAELERTRALASARLAEARLARAVGR